MIEKDRYISDTQVASGIWKTEIEEHLVGEIYRPSLDKLTWLSGRWGNFWGNSSATHSKASRPLQGVKILVFEVKLVFLNLL